MGQFWEIYRGQSLLEEEGSPLRVASYLYNTGRAWYFSHVGDIKGRKVVERTCLCVGEHSCSSQTLRKGSESKL